MMERFESERPAWRVLQDRYNRPSNESSWLHAVRPASSESNSEQRGGDLAMHRALLLRSVQNRGVEPDRNTHMQTPSAGLPPAPAASARPNSFHQALDVMGADGLSATRREQFLQAHRGAGAQTLQEQMRERDRRREVHAEAQLRQHQQQQHVRWGEVRDDPEALGRPPAFRPIRTRRRNSTSTLFAPPQENGDMVGTAAAAATLQSRGQATSTTSTAGNSRSGWGSSENGNGERSSTEEFLALMGSTMTGSHRARTRLMRERLRDFGGRDREDTLPRAFYRRRHRPGLGNMGDFMVSRPLMTFIREWSTDWIDI